MEDAGFKERRAFTRFLVKVFSRYLNLEAVAGESHAQTHDVSVKGLCLLTKEAIAQGTPLDIWLQMPDNGEQIYTKGIVVWSMMVEPEKYRIGINLENTELNPILLAIKTIQVRIRH
jgi:hypothetical protein